MNVFQDENVLPELLAMAVWDRLWLKQAGFIVKSEDFKPVPRGKGAGEQSNFYIIASVALEFYTKHRIPIGSLILQELARWKKATNSSQQRLDELTLFIRKLRKRYRPERSAALIEQVIEFKKGVIRQRTIRELAELEEQGGLTDERWTELMRAPLQLIEMNGNVSDWATGFDARQIRRQSGGYRARPALLIDELDATINPPGRGDLGLWIAGYKMGKSLAMMETATSYLWQGLNVLYFTLEDPRDTTEDRFDANVTELSVDELATSPDSQKRFEMFRDRLRSRLKIIDGTAGKMSVSEIFEVWERFRAANFLADAILVDYDAYIRPNFRNKDRRFDFDEIYVDFRNMLSRTDTIGWLASQAGRATEGKKIVGGDKIAEDIGKIQKATVGIGIGQSDWGEDARYIYVAAAKNSRCRFGFDIWSDPARGLFYDQLKTMEYKLANGLMENGPLS